MIYINYHELLHIITDILIQYKFKISHAEVLAEIFAENTLVGSTHGINRFPSFISLVKSGHIIPDAKPEKVNSFNSFEQWDGNLGPGPLNSVAVTERVMELAGKFGIGCVALKNTNHWMRPGYYAWKAADKGYAFICWTNTIPIMPPWGGKDPTVGNNPIVFGVPRKEGSIVLDMALSQFSYGKLTEYSLAGKQLPFAGGYDRNGKLTYDAEKISQSHRPLPIGYWKGSGLALMLDLFASILSSGSSTFDLSKSAVDSGMSQIYIAFDPSKFNSADIIERTVNEILEYYKSSHVVSEESISYPGERIMKNKEFNSKNGIPVEEVIWDQVQKLRSLE